MRFIVDDTRTKVLVDEGPAKGASLKIVKSCQIFSRILRFWSSVVYDSLNGWIRSYGGSICQSKQWNDSSANMSSSCFVCNVIGDVKVGALPGSAIQIFGAHGLLADPHGLAMASSLVDGRPDPYGLSVVPKCVSSVT